MKRNIIMLNREEILNKLRDQIIQWDNKIIDYEKALFRANHEVRIKMDREIEILKQRRNKILLTLRKLERAGDRVVENMTDDVDKSLKEIKNAFSKASVKIHDAVKF